MNLIINVKFKFKFQLCAFPKNTSVAKPVKQTTCKINSPCNRSTLAKSRVFCYSYSLFYILLELLNIHNSHASYKVIGSKDKILYGYSFWNITGITMDKCLAKCLEECKCSSFQICPTENKCQLCSSNRILDEKSFREGKGCTSFVFERQRPQVRNQIIKLIWH